MIRRTASTVVWMALRTVGAGVAVAVRRGRAPVATVNAVVVIVVAVTAAPAVGAVLDTILVPRWMMADRLEPHALRRLRAGW